ncbi:hypothetical protein [uncultured virus]|uniref:Uncharacterized protein n=1 Tax=uncultured virus TaxID=340016 RepID=A0A218MMP4_9VIRU|nr:hypothetical protein [uncultured virus]
MAYGNTPTNNPNYIPPNIEEIQNVDQSPLITDRPGTYGDTLVIDELTSKEIKTSFGRAEDYVELHIFNMQNQLLYT